MERPADYDRLQTLLGKKNMADEDLQQLSQDLNTFYGQFNTTNFSTEQENTLEELSR